MQWHTNAGGEHMKIGKETNPPGDRIPLDLPANFSGLIRVDPLGMYTGVPEGSEEQPVQDADDL